MEATAPRMMVGDYFITQNLKFIRSADAGNPDIEPVPTVSNNLASTTVMNGSYISEFDSTYRLKNQDTNDTVTLDIFSISLSYYDALIWNAIRTAECPVSFQEATANNQGEVNTKTDPSVIDFTIQDWNNFKFQQHYAQHLGSVTIGNADNENVVELHQTRVPSKCRRSQTGMCR